MAKNTNTPTKRPHKDFLDMVNEITQVNSPDIASFEDVDQFAAEFLALCEKYRKRAGFYE